MSLSQTTYSVWAEPLDIVFNIRTAETPELQADEHGITYISVDACLSKSCSWRPARLQRFEPTTKFDEEVGTDTHPYRLEFETPVSVDETLDGVQIASINGFKFSRGIGDEIFSLVGEPSFEELEEQAKQESLKLEFKIKYKQNENIQEFVNELASSSN